MKLTILFVTIAIFSGFAIDSYSQAARLTLNLEQSTIKIALKEIENQSEFRFFYSDAVNVETSASVSVLNKNIMETLDELFKGTGIRYEIYGRQIALLAGNEQDLPVGMQQPLVISGKITTLSGSPLPGVTVVIKGTITGTTTNTNGIYSLTNVPSNGTLLFSFVGMKTREIPVSGKTTIDVVMEEETFGVEEVVVTALGIERNKRSLSFSTEQVNMRGITTVRDISLGASLAGKVAGMNILTSSGVTGVGGPSRIVIRGDKSINGNNQPLIIVDGMPYSNSGPVNYKRKSTTDGLSDINPDDVESINVLKGPSAAALYGSAANNGVIIVTTKKGISGNPRFEFNSINTVDMPYLFPDYQNEYGQGAGGLFIPNSEFSWGPKMTGQKVTDWTKKETTLSPQPNNVKDFFTFGYNSTNTFSYSAGNEKSRTYFSYSNTLARSVIETDKLVRHNFNLRLNTEIISKLNLDFKMTYVNQDLANSPERGDSYFSANHQLMRMPRSLRTADIEVFEYFTPEKSRKQNFWNPGSTSMQNPYWAMNRSVVPTIKNRVNLYSLLRYDLNSNLYVQLRGGSDLSFNDGENMVYWDSPYINAGFGDYETQFAKYMNLNGDFLVGYNKSFFDDKFSVNITAGSEIKDSRTRYQTSTANGLSSENKFALNYAKTPMTTDGSTRIQTQSVYGMAQLGWKDYIYIDITARNDWSSTLPEPFDYFYPSVGLSWIVSEMIDLPDAISFAKIRGSYAEVGSGAGYAKIFQTFSRRVNGPIGYIWPESTKAPTDLKPERSKSWETGAELKFFKNRIGVDFTYYKSNTYNQLILVGVPPSSGYGSSWVNAGNIQNQGYEILLTGSPVKKQDFHWDVYLNFSRNKNEVKELLGKITKYQIESAELSIGDAWAIVGRPYGELYTKGFVRNSNGQIVVDALGMPKITNTADFYMGNFNHDWTSGLYNSFYYKNWQLSMFIDLNYGGVRQSSSEAQMMYHGTSVASLEGRGTGLIVPGVREDGTANNIKVNSEAYFMLLGGRKDSNAGEIFNHDATNSRLRELSIGYSFLLKSRSVHQLTLSAVGRNLFYFHNGCKWFDPEGTYDTNVNGQGGESASLPGCRTLGFNLKVIF